MFEGTIYQEGYGLIARKVMRDPKLKYQAKAIYAYICSFAAQGDTNERIAFPPVELQVGELGMTTDTYYKHRKALIVQGYLKIEKHRSDNGNFDNNIYKVCAIPAPLKDSEPYPKNSTMDDEPHPKKSATENPKPKKSATENSATKSNSLKSNSLKSNKFKIIYGNISEVQAELFRNLLRQYLFEEDEIENIIYFMDEENTIPTKEILRKLCWEITNSGIKLEAYNMIPLIKMEMIKANPKPPKNDIVAIDKEVDQLLKKLFPKGLHESKRKVIASLYEKHREEISIYQLQSILNGIKELSTRTFDNFYLYLNKVINNFLSTPPAATSSGPIETAEENKELTDEEILKLLNS